MPHFPRCERTQHKIIMAESGSFETFAAACLNVGNGGKRIRARMAWSFL